MAPRTASLTQKEVNILMPLVTVHMYPGRTPAQKAAVVRGIADVLVKEANASLESVEVMIMEVPREHWAFGGKLQHPANVAAASSS